MEGTNNAALFSFLININNLLFFKINFLKTITTFWCHFTITLSIICYSMLLLSRFRLHLGHMTSICVTSRLISGENLQTRFILKRSSLNHTLKTITVIYVVLQLFRNHTQYRTSCSERWWYLVGKCILYGVRKQCIRMQAQSEDRSLHTQQGRGSEVWERHYLY